jgi:nucleoside-diphosphate-sugar epimerase
MRIVVTGGSGLLGSRTVPALVAAGHSVVCVDTAPSREPGVEWHVADLRRRETPYAFLRDAEVVIHLANHSNASKADPQTVLGENVAMNVNVFQAAAELGVRRVIFSSSIQAVSGGPIFPEQEYLPPGQRKFAPLPYDGDTPASAGNTYGQSKIIGENLLAYYVEQSRGAMEGVTLRLPFIARNPRRVLKWLKPDHPYAASELFSWLWIEDAARLIRACVETPRLKGCRTYFPSGALLPDWPDAETLAQTYLADAPRRRPGERLEALIDISAITHDLGWTPTPWSEFAEGG